MSVIRRFASGSALAGVAFAAVLSVATMSRAAIVANLGDLAVTDPTAIVSCNTDFCSASVGTSGGSIPSSGQFAHYIVFGAATPANLNATNQVHFNTAIDTDNMSVRLYEVTGTTSVGNTDPTLVTLLATALKQDFLTTTNFVLNFAGLDPAKTYALQIEALGAGVLDDRNASYTQFVSLSPVPLPPALLLLGAALAGLIGFARIRRRRATANA